MNKQERNALIGLSAKWKARAIRKLADADRETNDAGRRLIEHGAMCMATAVIELNTIIDEYKEEEGI